MNILITYYVSGALVSFHLDYEVGIINCIERIKTLTQRS